MGLTAGCGMKASWMTGLSFGLTSGVITTLGLIVGLHAGTHSRMVVIGGILTVAISDAMSDALGIHISEEARKRVQHGMYGKQRWRLFYPNSSLP